MHRDRRQIADGRVINYSLNFVLLICGRFISELGSSVFGFALSLYVLDFTNSAAAFSLVLSFSIIPNMFVNLIAGSFVDKHDKKKTIVATDILSGIAVLSFMCMFHLSPQSILLLISYKIILAVTQSFFGLAISTSIPNIVGEKNTARVNSIFTTAGSLINILGPVVGAVAYKTIGLQYIFLIDGISFVLSGISEIFIIFERRNSDIKDFEQARREKIDLVQTVNDQKDKEDMGTNHKNTFDKTIENMEITKKEGYLSGVKLGFQYIVKDRTTFFFIAITLLMNLILSPLSALVIPFINYNVLKVSEVQLSVIQGSWAAGAIIGGLFMSLRKDTFRLIKHVFLLIQGQALIMVMFCFPTLNVPLFESKWIITMTFSLLLIILGILNVMQNVPLYTYFQIRVAENVRGRVFAVFNITIMLSSTIGLWLFGGILEHVKWSYVLVASASLMFILCVLLSKFKHFRVFTSSPSVSIGK